MLINYKLHMTKPWPDTKVESKEVVFAHAEGKQSLVGIKISMSMEQM